MSPTRHSLRKLRSFVRREGRMTPAQRAALEALLPRYVWPQALAAPDEVYPNQAPLVVEIGFGNGENLAAQAAAHPEINYLGLEVYRSGVGSLLRQAEELGLENLKVACDDAVEFLPERLPASAADVIQIFFPDPWPKKRHHKRRLICEDFLTTVAYALRPGGKLLLATDWTHYAQQMLETVEADERFVNLAGVGQFHARADRIETRFEARAKRLGHDIFDLAYARR